MASYLVTVTCKSCGKVHEIEASELSFKKDFCDCRKVVTSIKNFKSPFFRLIRKTTPANKSKSGKTEYEFQCLLCGRKVISFPNNKSASGITHICECRRYLTEQHLGNSQWKKYNERPRLFADDTIWALRDALCSDKLDKLEACCNCQHFETSKCKLTDVDLGTIDCLTHKCKTFEWWTGRGKLVKYRRRGAKKGGNNANKNT